MHLNVFWGWIHVVPKFLLNILNIIVLRLYIAAPTLQTSVEIHLLFLKRLVPTASNADFIIPKHRSMTPRYLRKHLIKQNVNVQ